MIITRTPYRISFFGGGTDYHTWYEQHGGAVLSTTINYYCSLICSHKPPFFENKHRIVWREIEDANEADDVKHPVVREVMKHMDIQRGIEVFHQGDLPARSGLGSSSSFTVGFLHAMYAMRGQMISKEQLAKEALHIEREVLKENVGVQDQIAASFGGLNRIDIHRDGNFDVAPIMLQPQRLQELKSRLLLFFTGISRNATDIAKEQISTAAKKTAELSEMHRMVDLGTKILTSNTHLEDFGRLLHESWLLKRGLSSSVSTDYIDELYQKARAAGATGGKLLGAGGGGFMLFFVEPEKQKSVLEALQDLLWVPFDFETKGTHVAMYNPTTFTRESLIRHNYAHLKREAV